MIGDGGVSLETILKVAEIVSILGGGGMMFYKLGRTTSRLEEALTNQSSDVTELKTEMKKLNDLMVTVAVQTQRLDGFSDRLNILDRRYDDLSHGRGFVMQEVK